MKLTGHRCKCGACGKHFSRASVFDKHRVGAYTDRRCMSDAEMIERGLQLTDGVWRGQPRDPAESGTMHERFV